MENPQEPTGCLICTNASGTWETAQANEYPKAMSAGIAAAMVRAVCKHQSIQTQVVPEEVMEFVFPFSFQLLQTREAFGAEFVD